MQSGGQCRVAGQGPAAHCSLPTDERFPFQASVEFVFSSSPEKIKGECGAWVGAEVTGPLSFKSWAASPQATSHGMTPQSLWTTTPQSLPCAGTRMRTSTSTTRTAWTVCGAPGLGEWWECGAHSFLLGTPPSQGSLGPLQFAVLSLLITPLPLAHQARWPTRGVPWMAVLMLRCSVPPARPHRHPLQSHPHPLCSLSAVTLAIPPH